MSRLRKRAWLVHGILIAAISGGLFWLVWIYGSGLRDPRYLDGWIMATGMGLQLGFHIAIKTARLPARAARTARSFHIFVGIFLIAAFISHSDFSLPDTAFEWVLWACFALVTVSGIFGWHLAWSGRDHRETIDRVGYDRIADRRAQLAQQVYATVADKVSVPAIIGLPAPPHDAWIMDLYATRLSAFFEGPRNVTAHLTGSKRPLKQLTEEIETLSRYVDKPSQDKLAAIKDMVVEKDRLDFAQVYHGLNRGWLYVHVPLTYALIVLTVLHVIVVYAYSSGAW